MSKMEQIWDEAYPVKAGQTVPVGTEFVTAFRNGRGDIDYLTVDILRGHHMASPHDEAEIRTTEPSPDLDDTGDASFYVYSTNVFADSVDIGDTEVTRDQARNFARKLLEELDGN